MSTVIDLKVPVDQPVCLKVVVIFSKGVNQLLCYLQDIKGVVVF